MNRPTPIGVPENFSNVTWCELCGVPTNKFDSKARTFAHKNPLVMRRIEVICTRLIEEGECFSFKDVLSDIRIRDGIKICNNIVTALQKMVRAALRYYGYSVQYMSPRSFTPYRPKRWVKDVDKFVDRYGKLLNSKDSAARYILAHDQDLHDVFVRACEDIVKFCETEDVDWKISIKDVLQATRLTYKIHITHKDNGSERDYPVCFSNTHVTYFARMMEIDVPAVKKLINPGKRIKHDLDREAELAVPEALVEALQ